MLFSRRSHSPRQGGTNNHIGNAHWRMLVSANKELYVSLQKKQKMLLSKSIVHAVRNQNPPGRFLQKDSNKDTWYDVGDQRAVEKTSQALREGAPDIRNKQKEQQRRLTPPKTAAAPTPLPPGRPVAFPATSLPPPIPPQGPLYPRKGDKLPAQSAPDRVSSLPSVEPVEALGPSEFSLGSLIITETEQERLETEHRTKQNDDMEPIPFSAVPGPVDDDLERIGLSFGTMMSIGESNHEPTSEPVSRLENAGLSYGTAMSAVTEADFGLTGPSVGSRMSIAPTVEGGLEPMGTSFGSLSMATEDRRHLVDALNQEAAEAAPTFLKLQKSTGNLLACSDTESEDETEQSANKSSDRSADWVRMQAAFAEQKQPAQPLHHPGDRTAPSFGSIDVPTTHFGRDFSQISVMSDGDGDIHPVALVAGRGANGYDPDSQYMPPPAKLEKADSTDWKNYEATMLQRGNSLAAEEFCVPYQQE